MNTKSISEPSNLPGKAVLQRKRTCLPCISSLVEAKSCARSAKGLKTCSMFNRRDLGVTCIQTHMKTLFRNDSRVPIGFPHLIPNGGICPEVLQVGEAL